MHTGFDTYLFLVCSCYYDDKLTRTCYMCFQLTRDDQQRDDNTKRYSLSKWAQCNTLISSYEGPYRLILEPGTLTNAPTASFSSQVHLRGPLRSHSRARYTYGSLYSFYDRLIAHLGLSD